MPASRRRPSPSLAAQTFAQKCGTRMPSGARPICAGRRAVSAVRTGSVRASDRASLGTRATREPTQDRGFRVTVLRERGRFIMGYQLDSAAESCGLER